MHIQQLSFFFTPLKDLKIIGTQNATKLAKLLNIANFEEALVLDLLYLLPYKIIDRSKYISINNIVEGNIVTIEATISNIISPGKRYKKAPYKINLIDDTGYVQLIYFNSLIYNYLKKFKVGDKVIVSGKAEKYRNNFTIAHPDYILPIDQKDKLPNIEIIYPATASLSSKKIAFLIKQIINNLPDVPEWLPSEIIAKYNLPKFSDAIKKIHNPANMNDLAIDTPWRKRLAFEELFAHQLALAIIRLSQTEEIIRTENKKLKLIKQLYDLLPYELTISQQNVINEIFNDLEKNKPMLRLIQGDVGSGKTIVALFAAIKTIQQNGQIALMSPTETLAKQHFTNIKKLTETLNINVEILTSANSKISKNKIIEELKTGKIDILIGTHALIHPDIIFKDLKLAIIDEQHRFGVNQRLQLSEYKKNPDTLLLTATPIPRSMLLATLGDMDISQLTEKPINRQPINTTTIAINKINQLISSLKNIITQNQQIYWVCPLIEETDKLPLTPAKDRYEILKKTFADKVGLLHGKMNSKEKDKIMEDFTNGKIQILVTTTVIEVGIDIANATVMIIENAERFGLAQLHQLRGRVGRSDIKSNCILLYQPPLSDLAFKRLSILKNSDDGFLIAEKDLELRGQGELLGTKQSGVPNFYFAQSYFHKDLLILANKLAKKILSTDERFNSIVYLPLYLFKKDKSLNLLRAG
ncbi:ATP-dependent DNA helicase RecG [Bartonella sp. DGB1]|uniref:ATP-dependent DNA helicase RecG n=1 Tax=Bartonella sp. DGB1 TaxID=3239807 RepID=UPI003526814D